MIVENINSTFNFGKYKGDIIKEVALKDPSYIEWLCKTVDLFEITNETIDEISEYCLSVFFSDPEKYLNEKGDFTLYSWQHLKYQGKEITIGIENIENLIKNISQKNELSHRKFQPNIQHISITFSRAIFNGEVCKKNLLERNNK